MDYLEWFPKRLAQLRIQKGISARDMSLSLGQSESYINKIENHRTLPSMTGFFYICDYLEIEPRDFFDYTVSVPQVMSELIDASKKLTYEQTVHILQIIDDITKTK